MEIQLHHGRITLQGFGPNTIYVKRSEERRVGKEC